MTVLGGSRTIFVIFSSKSRTEECLCVFRAAKVFADHLPHLQCYVFFSPSLLAGVAFRHLAVCSSAQKASSNRLGVALFIDPPYVESGTCVTEILSSPLSLFLPL